MEMGRMGTIWLNVAANSAHLLSYSLMKCEDPTITVRTTPLDREVF